MYRNFCLVRRLASGSCEKVLGIGERPAVGLVVRVFGPLRVVVQREKAVVQQAQHDGNAPTLGQVKEIVQLPGLRHAVAVIAQPGGRDATAFGGQGFQRKAP